MLAGYGGNGIPVRLVNSTSSNRANGYVQAFYNGQWGYICTRRSYNTPSWGINEANVVCRQLGYDKAVGSSTRYVYVHDSNNFVISEVVCRGDENNLTECSVDANFETTTTYPDWYGDAYEVNPCLYGTRAGATCSSDPDKGTVKK